MAKRKQAAEAATNAPEAIDAAADQGITDAQQPTGTTEDQPEEQGAARKPFVSRLPDPHGRHMIDIGDGRKMRLFLNRQFNQNAIQFTAPEGENPKPAPEDIEFLKDHGFSWRNGERVWTKQLARNTDENRYAGETAISRPRTSSSSWPIVSVPGRGWSRLSIHSANSEQQRR